MKKLVISGGWSYGNLGDEVIAKCTIELCNLFFVDFEKIYTSYDTDNFVYHHSINALESVHSCLERYCTNESIQSYRNIVQNYKNYGLTTFYNLLDDSSVFIMSGGGYFDGNWESQFLARIVEIEIALQKGAKVILIGQSIGPFSSDEQIQIVQKLLNRCSYISVRDMASKRFLDSIVANTNISFCGDMAITISDFYPRGKINRGDEAYSIIVQQYAKYVENGKCVKNNPIYTKIAKRINGKLYIYNYRYIRMIKTLGDKFGMQVNIVLNCATTAKHKNDHFKRIALKYKRKYDKVRIIENMHVNDFVDALVQGKATISCKMHPLIISASYGIPIIALSQHYKIDAFMSWIHREEYCFRNDRFSPKVVCRMLACIENETMERWNGRVSQCKKEVYDEFNKILSIVTTS